MGLAVRDFAHADAPKNPAQVRRGAGRPQSPSADCRARSALCSGPGPDDVDPFAVAAIPAPRRASAEVAPSLNLTLRLCAAPLRSASKLPRQIPGVQSRI